MFTIIVYCTLLLCQGAQGNPLVIGWRTGSHIQPINKKEELCRKKNGQKKVDNYICILYIDTNKSNYRMLNRITNTPNNQETRANCVEEKKVENCILFCTLSPNQIKGCRIGSNVHPIGVR